MSETERIDRELDRLRELLVSILEVNRYSIRSLEKRLGLGVGTLRRALNGEVRLTLRQLLAVVRGVGLRWEDFFAAAYPEPGEVAAALVVAPKGLAAPVELSAEAKAAVEKEVRELLIQILAGRSGDPPPEPDES